MIIVSEIMGQTTSSTNPTCSNSNLQMTPSLRQKVLDAMNEVRQTVKNGQMLLYNGQYALPAEEMPILGYNCEKEEDIHEYLEAACAAFPSTNPNNPVPDFTWNYYGSDVGAKDNFVHNGLYYSAKFGISSTYSLSRSPFFTGPQGSGALNVINSKAQTVSCAIYDCDVRGKVSNYPGNITTTIMCTLDSKVQFGEAFYDVASSATNYIPPSQDVICPDTIFTIERREMIMSKINEIRSKIAAGNYELQNGNNALKATNLNNLAWSCAEEAAIGASLESLTCDNTLYNPATEFQKILRPTSLWVYPEDIKGYLNELINEYFVSNPNYNFLSTSATYSTEYPAAFALSDQATSFACNVKFCRRDGPSFYHPDFHYICRAKPAIQINQPLYQI
uniref:Uncharacterized protein n=1 Tax=Panagrolaimus davidi TaxID=227884 RepID=A0A914P961_9BILA